jgi:diguanylate cyclase (GGDEF)-like protein/PAS domain S-box-containing protein
MMRAVDQCWALLNNSAMGLLFATPENVVLQVNSRICDMLGYSSNELVGQSFALIHVGLEMEKAFVQQYQSLHNSEIKVVSFEFPFKRKHGDIMWCYVSGTLLDETDVSKGIIWIMLDITERVEVEEGAESQLRLSAKVFEQSREGIVVTAADASIISVNKAFVELTGFNEAEALGKNPRFLASGRHHKNFYQLLWDTVVTTGHWQGEIWNRRKDGSIYPEWLSITRVLNPLGVLTNYIGIFSDITHRKIAEEKIQRMAHYDPLTGLPNRALLVDRANQAIRRAERNGESLALLYVDLDHFKNINDTLGHSVGDELLVELAQRLKVSLREQDTVSRQGGDEFIILLPDTTTTGAIYVAEKLLQVIPEPFRVGDYELITTPSIGVAIYPADGEDLGALSKSADIAMYRAKQSGRNSYQFFTPEMQKRSTRYLQLEHGLRRALERNELFLQYQPQVSLDHGKIVGVEALLRWQHPELGLISPVEFIPMAEESGLILPIGEWVLRTAIHQMKSWIDQGLEPIIVAVNLSAVQFRQRYLPQLITHILDEEGLPAQYLELELTESMAMNEPEVAIAMMDALHERGVRLSIDDFGTGYSSLAYLKRFQIDKLKIDQSFVRDIASDSEDEAIIDAVISMAKSLKLRTIAEGVENEQQLQFLRDKDCEEMQGFYLSRPIHAADFLSWMGDHQ